MLIITIKRRVLKAVVFTTIGFAIGGAFGLGIGARLLFLLFVGTGIGGAVAGLFLGTALAYHPLAKDDERSAHSLANTFVGATAGAFGGIFGLLLLMTDRLSVAMVMGGGLAGFCGGSSCAMVLDSEIHSVRSLLTSILGWTVGGALGALSSFLVAIRLVQPAMYSFGSFADWAASGAVGGIVFGVVGSGILFWQLDQRSGTQNTRGIDNSSASPLDRLLS